MMTQEQAAQAIKSLRAIGSAFSPGMEWDKEDYLRDSKGLVGAEIDDYILLVFHMNGNRSHYCYDFKHQETFCCDFHQGGGE